MTEEELRLAEARDGRAHWRRWGPYLSERQWGTVREDYSPDGHAWEYLPHDHARSRAYRWGEDGIAGLCDERQRLCFALALWNGADPILKERMFGLSSAEGNHGEDVKECYFYLDNVPSHAYMKCLYKYPQRAFPYADLVATNGRRTRDEPEYELLDTGVFDDDRYFDVFVEYAKARPDDILVRISIANRGPEAASLHVLPTLWFKNDWSWFPANARPRIEIERAADDGVVLKTTHRELEPYHLYCEPPQQVLFTENETNTERLFGAPGASPYVKDAFHAFVVDGRTDAVNPARVGTKAAAHYVREIGPGETAVVRLRLSARGDLDAPLAAEYDRLFAQRREEADAFYRRITPFEMPDDMRNVQRQAFAGMLWTKQYYRYFVHRWLAGDPAGPPPPVERGAGRNHRVAAPRRGRRSVDAGQVGVPVVRRMGHGVPHGRVRADRPGLREGPADPAAPRVVHASERPDPGLRMGVRRRQPAGPRVGGDPRLPDRGQDVRAPRPCLPRARVPEAAAQFHVVGEPEGPEGNNIFQGGFLGLDNIGAFDRTAGLPGGGELEQADGTSWMAMYCLNMLAIALELAREDPVYQDIATKFFEHFVQIGAALNRIGGTEGGLWSAHDGFYFDRLKMPDGRCFPISAYTIAGLVPVFAVAVADQDTMRSFTEFTDRFRWFARYRPELLAGLADITHHGMENRVRLALTDSTRLRRILAHVLDENGLLSPHGVRSVSKQHAARALRAARRRPDVHARLHAGRVDRADVRRQFELARPGVDAAQLPADRGAAEAPLLPGRRRSRSSVRRAPGARRRCGT